MQPKEFGIKVGNNLTNNLMFIGPCIILIVEKREINLMSLTSLFHYLMLNMFRMLIHPSPGACLYPYKAIQPMK